MIFWLGLIETTRTYYKSREHEVLIFSHSLDIFFGEAYPSHKLVHSLLYGFISKSLIGSLYKLVESGAEPSNMSKDAWVSDSSQHLKNLDAYFAIRANV